MTESHNKIAVVAHDLVGAMRSIELYANFAVTPAVILDGNVPEECDVISMPTMSKITTPRTAYMQTRKAISLCRNRYLSLYENTYLMGNIPADIQAALDELQPQKIVVCTAWPELNSTVIDSYSYLGNKPVSQSIRATDPVTPIKESSLPRAISKYSGLIPKLIYTNEIDRGPEHISRLIKDCPNRIIICDATRQYHLKHISEVIVQNRDTWIACGSGGLIEEFPYRLYGKSRHKTVKPVSNFKPVLMVLGTLSDVTAIQLSSAAEQGLVYPILVEPGDFWSREKREHNIQKLVDEAGQHISRGENVAISSTCSRFIPQLRKTAAYLLSTIAKDILDEHNIEVMLARGADTSYALCKTLELTRLEIEGRITDKLSPTIVKGYTYSGKTYRLCLSGGNNGAESLLIQMLRYLRQV
jgi:uncharacterized protein YgbK (DUF1537 family)